MSWGTDDGRHEGYCVPIFGDGERGRGVSGGESAAWVRVGDGDVWDDAVTEAEAAVAATGVDVRGRAFYRDQDWGDRPNGYWRRPTAEVTGWQVLCNCASGYSSFDHTVWGGPIFTRVPSKALERLDIDAPGDLGLYAVDEDVLDRTEDVDDFAHELWRRYHVTPLEGVSAIGDAAAAVSAAERKLDEVVAQARRGGISWEIIGREVGLTKQAAHARWRDGGTTSRR